MEEPEAEAAASQLPQLDEKTSLPPTSLVIVKKYTKKIKQNGSLGQNTPDPHPSPSNSDIFPDSPVLI